jgi:glycosyltransferase involved in cell wall biosynthesis
MGGMEKSVKDYYGKLVEELGLSQNVTFTGFVTDQEAIKMINSSRLFVLPSLEEGFGLTVLEAMATGLPCILTNIPALRENFDPPAVFVEPQDPEQLSRAILALLSNPEKRQELGQKGRKLAKQFSWDKVAEKELHALNKVMV